MEKSKLLLKKLKPTNNKVSPIVDTTPITPIISHTLPKEQKEAALPFLTTETKPSSIKSKLSKTKSLGKFFKKLAKATTKTTKKINTEYKLTFIPIIKKSEMKSEAKEIVWTQPVTESHIDAEIEIAEKAQDSILSMSFQQNTQEAIAQRIWDEDETVYENLSHVVEWIGDGKPSSNAILKAYMNHFDFSGLKLEQAFRNLCTKLHLKGETQQIDRVLSEFAGRYFECNTNCIFGSTDVVHAIVYSLLLLNTDLHIAQGDYKKMSRSEFVNNTMNVIQNELDTFEEDDETSIQQTHQSLNSILLQRTPSNQSTVTYQSNIPRTVSSYGLGSKNWQLEIKNSLKEMYNSINKNQIMNPSSPPSSINQPKRMSSVFKRHFLKKNEEETSLASAPSSTDLSINSQLYQTELPTTYTTNAPYYKEGMVVRKHLLEKRNQKAKQRDWKDCFMIIEKSLLYMYKLDATTKKSKSVEGSDWISNAILLGTIDLKHTLATVLPSGYSRQRQFAFTLEQSNGSMYVFQVGSEEQVQEWVSTCNYWAARESKEPLSGGVSSMEYGWGNCLTSSEESMVYEWQEPAAPTMISSLDEISQFNVLSKYVKELSNELDQHHDIKYKIQEKFSGSKLESKVMNNWENKSNYLLREIIKYQNYCDSIEKSIQFQNTIINKSTV